MDGKEDARVWAQGNHPFDMHLNPLGQHPIFLHPESPLGAPSGVAAGNEGLLAANILCLPKWQVTFLVHTGIADWAPGTSRDIHLSTSQGGNCTEATRELLMVLLHQFHHWDCAPPPVTSPGALSSWEHHQTPLPARPCTASFF